MNLKFETGDGTEIQDDPHLYWKCWRTDTPTGEGFTNRNISVSDLFGSVFATPYLPSLSADRADDRGLKLMQIGVEQRSAETAFRPKPGSLVA